jgi:hypothetical protein
MARITRRQAEALITWAGKLEFRAATLKRADPEMARDAGADSLRDAARIIADVGHRLLDVLPAQ